MLTQSIQTKIANLLVENGWLLEGTDLLIKSMLVLLVVYIIAKISARRISHGRDEHLMWLNGFLCLIFLLVAGGFGWSISQTVLQTDLLTVTVTADTPAATATKLSNQNMGARILLIAYLVPCFILLIHTLVAIASVLAISRRSIAPNDSRVQQLTESIAKRLGIGRRVTVKQSNAISSPFSLGILDPQIIVPNSTKQWSDSALEDVLVHELYHIKRFDWFSCWFAMSLPVCIGLIPYLGWH